jgi:hypothetical protein
MKCTQYYKIHNTEHKTIFVQNTEQIGFFKFQRQIKGKKFDA